MDSGGGRTVEGRMAGLCIAPAETAVHGEKCVPGRVRHDEGGEGRGAVKFRFGGAESG
ncbi:hypothetical protein BV95_01918 [Sphingobium chlorophenolicum]|uniref:Uncharacterized protein n=1 Tax=Sphingobium chlorophenolicum TaxID=46429 RepID=A0A081RFA0_SPHCR|nr:hypothetical protein BV95_01918 [Sphingobium chlorophenolicum]